MSKKCIQRSFLLSVSADIEYQSVQKKNMGLKEMQKRAFSRNCKSMNSTKFSHEKCSCVLQFRLKEVFRVHNSPKAQIKATLVMVYMDLFLSLEAKRKQNMILSKAALLC